MVATTTFDECCVWQRTGQSGYYFQEHNNKLYYLYGSYEGLRVITQSRTAATDKMSTWFNWDYGAAVKEIIFTDGRRKERYYWLMLNTTNNPGVWEMSCNSYERPDVAIWDNYDFGTGSGVEAANRLKKYYYCNTKIRSVDENNVPTGTAALVMPVKITHFPKHLPANLSGYGLQGVTFDIDNQIAGAPADALAYGGAATVNTNIVGSNTPIAAIQVTPEYWLYAEETYRYGINTNYNLRNEDDWNKAGIPTIDTHYYYYTGAVAAFHDDPPTSTNSDLVVESISYNLTPSSFRFLKFEIAGVEIDAVGEQTLSGSHLNDVVKIVAFQVPPLREEVKLTVTVRYTNGAEQTGVYTVPLSSYYHRAPMPEATNAPVVHGSVFGGGRMASVAQNTNVTVHNTDSIYALYGGNDIAGWVQGDGGATLRIGTDRTNSTAQVKIGWVYGGGCGYYCYRGVNLSNDYGYPYGTDKYGVAYQNYYFGSSDPSHPDDASLNFDGAVYPWGTVPTWDDPANAVADDDPITAADTAHLVWPPLSQAVATGFRYNPVTNDPAHVDNSETGNGGTGTIPYVKTSHIVVGTGDVANDYIHIDTLFGGAENAFIGVESFEETPANAITMDINGGIIYTVFGGNNYGGSVAQTATVLLTVNGTTLPEKLEASAGGDSTHAWPIADYKVRKRIDDRSIFTGIGREYGIRYLYGGGNMVDGSHALVTIKGGMLDTVFGGGNAADVNLPVVRVECLGENFICDNLSYWPSNPAGIGPENWEGVVGNYNIRTLFGGNNRATSNTLGYLELISGGVSCVYGGGNQGDMNNEAQITRAELRALMAQTLANAQIPSPINVGSIVYAPEGSDIVCDYMFGGCRMANVLHSSGCVLYGGTYGYVNGGNDVSGDVGSTIPTTLLNSQGKVTDDTATAVMGLRDGAYVFLAGDVLVVLDAQGGSDGYYHCSQDGVYYDEGKIFDTYSGENYDPYNEFVGMPMPTHNNSYFGMFDSHPGDPSIRPVVLGNVMAGGVHANVGFDEKVVYDVTPADGIKNGSTHLSMLGGYVAGDVFGGGYMSDVFGLGYLHVGGTVEIAGSLFAGNDLLGSVGAFGGYTFNGVPSEANYTAAVTTDGTSLNTKEGNDYNAQYSCYLKIDGTPKINCVYGGGNGNYDYNDPDLSICVVNGKVNRPLQSSSYIDINVTGDGTLANSARIDTVFGGGNGIGVQDVVTVLLNCRDISGEYVGTIFGGNNRDDMTTCVPDIQLKEGQVHDVYGGGNMGSMSGSAEFRDACNQLVTGVSTHIKIDNSTHAQVNGTIYGGCRMANVTGMAFVEIRGSEVNKVFGGNDLSGSVSGNTRIDVSGGTVHSIFGGSNGYYDYAYVDNKWDIYTFNSDHTDPVNYLTRSENGRPYVDSTTVNLYGGTITTDVYGGGNLGDCRLTLVEVDDQACPALTGDLTVQGAIYGGGKGIDFNLNAERQGNVLTQADDDRPSRTHVNLRHAHSLATNEGKVKAYGGGRGGDVMDTYITAFDTWDTPFDDIYGGCWGSDVRGETHLILNGSTANPTAMTAENVYGGNDFTGATYATNITINSGRYGNIFGGGNGAYDEDRYIGGDWNSEHTVFTTTTDPNYSAYAGNYTYADTIWNAGVTIGGPRRVFEPNNEYARIDFNDGNVTGNLYGGGRQGTTMRYKRTALVNGVWLTQAGGASKIPDTFRSLYHFSDGHAAFDTVNVPTDKDSVPYTDPKYYSNIIINVKNGTFEHNIYAGGMGKEGGSWIVYGLKEVNIENGLIKESVYGGSENVNDGYPRECWNKDSTTMRPSSIVNITGGTIKNNVYGSGYLGNVYGSVYVNVGIDAVDSCVLWKKTINGKANAYALFKPGATDGYVPAMTANELQLQASIFGGANWGDNVGSSDFSKQGFYGGESRILVDGEGYNTYMDASHDLMPLMNIVHSIIGAGTSADGGDVHNRIDVRNYGALNPSTCKPTRQLHAIQRARALWLENTVIDYTGATDAISAYLSQQYTINRVDTLNCVGYNVVDIDATMTNVANVNFLYNKAYSDALVAAHSTGTPALERNDTYFEPSHTYMYTLNGLMPEANVCAEGASICLKLESMDRDVDSKSLTALVINNGINVDIIGADGAYGAIRGYAIMAAQSGTNAVVTARAKYNDGGSGPEHVANPTDGGFTTTCINDFQAINTDTSATSGSSIVWCNCFENDAPVTANNDYCVNNSSWVPRLSEFPYSNYSTMYRVWKLGDGKRRRYSVIQAHSNPDSMYTMEGNTKVYSNKKITLRYNEGSSGHDSLYNFSIATANLVLPPTTPGNFYVINANGVSIDDENQEMRLTDMSYKPVWNSLSNTWKVDGGSARDAIGSDVPGTNYEATANGEWDTLHLSGSGMLLGANHIHDYTGGNQYFGLMMCSGKNFETGAEAAPLCAPASWTDGTTVSGNNFTNMIQDFATARVSSTVNASPEIKLYLLYDNNFSHTMIGTVTFTLEEHTSVPRRANYDGTNLNTNTGAIVPGQYLDSNLNADIEVEITITTILQDFVTMEYEVLAMYNEGRNDLFSRKVVLPATLQQRELYLEGVSWFPTSLTSGPLNNQANGDTISDAIDPDWFYMTDNMDSIKGQADSLHSYFGMTVLPTDNVSNTLTTANSWHTISQTEPLDLYDAFESVYGNHPSPLRAFNDDYYQDASHTIKTASLKTESNPHGIKMGNLDGRGEAALNVTLKYDGERVYGAHDGKGYVGKVVMTMVSYTGGKYEYPNRFNVVMNIKTRAHGDTIYLASPDYFDDNAGATGTHTIDVNGTDYYAKICTDWGEIGAGKNPHSCATSFYDALTKVYQEGDVIAILGEVKIGAGEQVLIKGQEYMPIPVIRYEGHNYMMPGEPCVYRGTMISVEGNTNNHASFTARCIEFKGSMISKIQPNAANGDGTPASPNSTWLAAHPATYNPIDPTDYKFADTNIAYGPIISVKDNATVQLQHGVILEHNNNGYWSPSYQTAAAARSEAFDPSRMGAVSVTGGELKLLNNVTIKHNICNSTSVAPNSAAPASWGIHPQSGAIYVDGGRIYIGESNRVTAILIDSNYLADTTDYWIMDTVRVGGALKLKHYDFNNDIDYGETGGYYYDNTNRTRANVYLARTEGAGATQADRDMNDLVSEVIVFDKPITEGTHIGVSKWFPDDAQVLRDTIKIAYQADGTYMLEAEVNENFFADNPSYFTFYDYGVDNVLMYMGRCATFKYQQLTDPLTQLGRSGSHVYTDTAIYYRPLSGASCPIGGDTIITRAQGGFFPYTYTWYNAGANFNNSEDDITLRTRKTPYTNKIVMSQMGLSSPNYAPLASAVADTLYTDYIDMPFGELTRTLRYVVTISDATEHCKLTKQVAVTLVKNSGGGADFEKTGTTTAWAALDAPNTVSDSCTGNRNYAAVQIIPRVKTPGSGAVAIESPYTRDIYIISDDVDYSLVTQNLRFCQGDVLRLAAEPIFHLEDDTENPAYDPNTHEPKKRVYDSKFMMWDFDPYYSNPTSHVVPSHDETVVAYFAPLNYWKDVVTSTSIAHAVYDANFTYTTRSAAGDAAAGMVTTYNGDVHIYNENGLAWLISCINGFNGTQARTFHYNRVYLHYKDGGYDMKDHMWTPMGTLQHPFEGTLIGVGNALNNADSLIVPWTVDANGDPLIDGNGDTVWTAPIVIKNIIVDEPNLENAGFFAVLDSARIINIQLQGATIRGAHNVGTLAARSSNSRMRRVNVSSAPASLPDAADDETTTILSTHYLSGGMIGLSNNDNIIGSEMIAAKFIGDAVYSGGVYGDAKSSILRNSTGQNINRLRGLYVGGIAGRFDGDAPMSKGLFRCKTAGVPSIVENNYFRVNTSGAEAQRVGGVAGYTENTVIANNYIYGDLDATQGAGGVTAVAADGSQINHNYYETYASKIPTDNVRGNAVIEDVSHFNGEGNHVTLANSVYGVDNLTRALNKWVREHNAAGGNYLTWRSDLTEQNNGYPVFGQPDIIPVDGSLSLEGCEEVVFEGRTYTVDITLVTNVVDSVEMIDSTTTVTITVHHGTRTDLADSATFAEGYEGYGFTVTPTEAMLLTSALRQDEPVQLVLSDTLQTAFGCDSIVTLTLTFSGNLEIPEVEVTHESTVNVYPNPTTHEVNIEAEQMKHVELYDNEGRILADYDAYGGDKLRINVSQLASGIYYLRVHTPNAVTIQKIVKR